MASRTAVVRFLSPIAWALIALAPCPVAADNWTAEVEVMDPAGFSELITLNWQRATYMRWIKFTWVPGGEPDLYFQDSQEFPFHYPFAAAHIPEFSGYSANDYNLATLYNTGRTAFAGAVLAVESPYQDSWGRRWLHAVALQISGLDPLPAETVGSVFERVRAALTLPEGVALDYLPTYEQTEAAAQAEDWLNGQGISIRSLLEWSARDTIYSEGWAIGRLVRLEANQVQSAYLNGELLPTDILLIDAVPAELPLVAGIITEFPATPNSHVAILANSWDIPFIHNSGAAGIYGLIGETISLRAGDRGFRISYENPDVNPELYAEVLSLKTAPQLTIRPMARDIGMLSMAVDDLVPDDIDLVGGKAANFGLLRRAIPDNSPHAIAFTFDLWNAFMDQRLGVAGPRLRDEIAARLAPFDAFPPDFRALQVTLDGIRNLIRNQTDFSSAQKSAIIEALAAFDASRKIRFRSSTNVEDSEFFTGAGLYDSYSGCLLDDLDGDAVGPSVCDASEPSERGVFRAMRRVFASFYNANAFLERLRHGVDETDVGMAILVHHSYPDPIELANGVIVYDPQLVYEVPRVEIVTQKGAVSVTNPEGSAIAEVVTATLYSNFGPNYYLQQASSLLILGEKSVMDWDSDYRELGNHVQAVATGWMEVRPDLADRRLEFEFKKLAPDGRLEIKQVRPMPPVNRTVERHFLLPGSVRLQTFQGEYSDAVTLHRAKVDLRLQTGGTEISAPTAASLYSDGRYEHAGNGTIEMWEGAPPSWPGAAFESYRHSGGARLVFRDSWDQAVGGTTAKRTLEAEILPGSFPIHFLGDFDYQLITDYAEAPVPSPVHPFMQTPIRPSNLPEETDAHIESVRLTRVLVTNAPSPSFIPVERGARLGEVEISARFYWPPYPQGLTAGYTAPLAAWDQSVISGLTSSPLVLTSYYSQTYRPEHHNFDRTFVFEPHLDPMVPESLKTELDVMGIRYILSGPTGIMTAPADGDFEFLMSRWLGDVEWRWRSEYRSPWFGDFDAEHFPWIDHEALKSAYVAGSGPDDVWLYPYDGEGWLWTASDLYPLFYSASGETWMQFIPESVSETARWWFDFGTQSWRYEQHSNPPPLTQRR